MNYLKSICGCGSVLGPRFIIPAKLFIITLTVVSWTLYLAAEPGDIPRFPLAATALLVLSFVTLYGGNRFHPGDMT